MKTLFDSLVRTYVPWLAAIIVGWLVGLGVPLDENVAPALTALLFLVASAVYYLAVRLLEMYVSPKFGWLLGLAKPPEYGAPSKDEILAAHSRLDPDEQNADIQAAVSRDK